MTPLPDVLDAIHAGLSAVQSRAQNRLTQIEDTDPLRKCHTRLVQELGKAMDLTAAFRSAIIQFPNLAKETPVTDDDFLIPAKGFVFTSFLLGALGKHISREEYRTTALVTKILEQEKATILRLRHQTLEVIENQSLAQFLPAPPGS